jgi:hypothetical protein
MLSSGFILTFCSNMLPASSGLTSLLKNLVVYRIFCVSLFCKNDE